MVTRTQRRELLGLALLGVALFLVLSLVPRSALGALGMGAIPSGNAVGPLGVAINRWGYRLIGAGMPLMPLLPALAGVVCFGWMPRGRGLRWLTLLGGLTVLAPVTAALAGGAGGLPGEFTAGAGAGWLGATIAEPLVAVLGWLGAWLTLLFLALALCVATLGWNPVRAAARGVVRASRPVGSAVRRLRERREAEAAAAAVASRPPPGSAPVAETDQDEESPGVLGRALKKVGRGSAPEGERDGKGADGKGLALEDPGDPESADRPPLSLLSEPPGRDASFSEEELDRLGGALLETLETFKVEGDIAGRTTGPVVTQFEFVPAPGIKVNKVANLDADLALGLKASSVRIAPIPGKGAVGVEVPNPEPEVVHLRAIVESPAFRRTHGTLPLALGKDLMGRPYVADLARMPHLLIAGATGSGKSVCINTLITSLIYRYSPSEMRLLLIDPKMVELIMYEELPHLRHPVVTDPEDAATVLKWAVMEMERRYALLSENGARSVREFNRRVEAGKPLRWPADLEGSPGDGPGGEGDPDRWLYDGGTLPYVVVVVDELADLMMQVQAEIERPLAKLAQKARAIGIHLIVATQRPSVNVVTGLIKANFPSRIAFRVSSKVDSRTILDQNGADALLGNGDMLFLPPGHSDPVRIQGAFIDTADTESLMEWFRDRGGEPPSQESDILHVVREREAEEQVENVAEAVLEDRDALFRQAAELCVQHDQGSTSMLQRRLRIGYGRAARIIDQLHHAGIVGPSAGSKPRDVLVGMDALDEACEEG